VPHNLALCKPGSLGRVGAAVNALVTDPEAAARQYVPDSPDVIAFTDIVPPHARFTISFRAPESAGRHPFLCTFPGHWMAMQGELVVENPAETPPAPR
jgi:azurin